VPDFISRATLKAPAIAAPLDMPEKSPSRVESSGRFQMPLVLNDEFFIHAFGMIIRGTIASCMFFNPWMVCPTRWLDGNNFNRGLLFF